MKRVNDTEQALEGYGLYAAIVLMIVYMLNFLDRQLLAVLAEAIKADLRISDAQLGFLFGTAFAVFYSVFGMPLAQAADVGNRKNLVSGSVAFWSVMTSLSAFVTGFPLLAACRFGVGFGEAGASPASYSLLYDYFPTRLRATAIGLYSAGVSIGSGVGLFLGGAIMGWWNHRYTPVTAPLGLKGWQAAFLAVGLPGLLMALWMLTLREPPRGRYDDGDDARRDLGIAQSPLHEFFAAFISLVPIVNLQQLAKGPNGRQQVRTQLTTLLVLVIVVAFLIWLTGDIAQWLAVGFGVFAAASWIQGVKARDAATYRLILGNRTLVLAIAAVATVMFASYSFTFWTVPLYQRLFAASAQQTGKALGIANAIGGCLGLFTGGFVADLLARNRLGGKIYVIMASVVLSGIAALFLLFAPDSRFFFWADTVFIFTVQMGIAPFLSFIADQVPARARATTTALTLLSTNLVGFAIGPYVIGKVSDLFVKSGQSPGHALRTAMLLSLVAMPASAILVWRARRSYISTHAR